MLKIQIFLNKIFKIIKDLRSLSGGLCPHSALLGSANVGDPVATYLLQLHDCSAAMHSVVGP
jgi:hypothetical protein